MKLRNRIVALVFVGSAIAACSHPAGAADPVDDLDTPYWRTNLFKRFAYDQKFLVTLWFPAEVRRPAFLGPMLAGLLVAASPDADEVGWDPALQRDFATGRSGTQIAIAHDLTTLGNPPYVVAALGLTYLAARRARSDDLASAASLSAEALLDVGLWTIVVKKITARTRPGPGSDGAFFQWGSARSESFPSGHAAVAFAVATVFAEQFGERHRWVPWVTYGTATLISASRVAVGQHYPGDVLVGATLGHSIGEAVQFRNGMQRNTWYRHLTPVYDTSHRGWGVGYERRW